MYFNPVATPQQGGGKSSCACGALTTTGVGIGDDADVHGLPILGLLELLGMTVLSPTIAP